MHPVSFPVSARLAALTAMLTLLPLAAAGDFLPAIVYDFGGKFDRSFNQSASEGAERFKKETGIDLSKQPDAVQRIKEEAEKAKIALSSTQEYDLNLPFVTADATADIAASAVLNNTTT